MKILNNARVCRLLLSCCLLGIFYFTTGFVVVGHRGDPINAPEETFQSDDIAFSQGANYVELDLHRSADGVLVISHDRDLQRITGQSVIVSSQPFAQLQTLHQANGEPMHSLDELFAHYQNNPNARFLLETKKTAAGNPKDMEALIAQSVQKYHMQDRVMVHSFSLESLKEMQKLLPDVPRIFIVGSLKRINFDALQYVTAINISSELVTPDLVNQLHALGKKVFVWDEMTEKQQSWNYIVNLPIDGVVTNYPAIGASYQKMKDDARLDAINEDGALISTKPVVTFTNPYRPDLTRKKLTPFKQVHVSQKIDIDNQAFYQIGENRFVSADAVNLNNTLPTASVFLNQTVRLKGSVPMHVAYASPLYPERTTGMILPNTNYQIQAVRAMSGALWFKLKPGWVQSSGLLVRFKSMANDSHFALNRYLTLPADQRISTVDLNASLPALKYFHHPIAPETKAADNLGQDILAHAKVMFAPLIMSANATNKLEG